MASLLILAMPLSLNKDNPPPPPFSPSSIANVIAYISFKVQFSLNLFKIRRNSFALHWKVFLFFQCKSLMKTVLTFATQIFCKWPPQTFSHRLPSKANVICECQREVNYVIGHSIRNTPPRSIFCFYFHDVMIECLNFLLSQSWRLFFLT